MRTFKTKRGSNLDKNQFNIRFLYILSLFAILIIFVLIKFSAKIPNDENTSIQYIDITDKWTLDKSGKTPVDVNELGKHIGQDNNIMSIYYQLPEINHDINLIYRSKDVYTSVCVEGEKLYETTVFDSKWYNDSPGNLWNILTIDSNYSGQCLELQIKVVYDDNAITIDSLMLGDKAEIILDLFSKNLIQIIVSLLLILIGLTLIVLNFLPSYGRARTDHSLFWIGLFALLTGIWCLIETNMLQFCVSDMRIIQLVDNIIMIIDSVPLLIYMDCEHNILKNPIMRILGYVNVFYILLCMTVHIFNLGDMHHMLNLAIILMIITDISLFIWVLSSFIKSIKEKNLLLNNTLQFLGISSLWCLAVFEAIRTYNSDKIDRAGLIRIGMLLLCIFWSLSSQLKTYRLIVQGLEYDFISNLAYSDGLTGIGNRTAYMEKIDEYIQKAPSSDVKEIGIIYFDVNNLKNVNDKQGHEFGDKLIQAAADIIKNSFGLYGETYRIGGDEFAVLMEGGNLKDNYKNGNDLFFDSIVEINKIKKYPFEIQIAHGFTICEKLTREQIDYSISIADSLMYENKIRLKTNLIEEVTE